MTHELAPEIPPPSAGEAPADHHGPMNQRRVLLLALPIIGENLLQTAVGAVDTLLVSRIGDEAVAGVGVGAELVFFALAILSAVSIGATVLVSQAIGSGDRHRANRFARQSISWGIALAIPLSIAGYTLADPLIGVFGTEPDVRQLAVEYFEVIGATTVVLLLSYLLGAVLRGAGDSRTPLKAAVIANVINVFATYVLITGEFGFPELGVAGSAWGSTIARSIAALYMFRALWRGKAPVSVHARSGWWPQRRVGIDLFRLGIPAAIEQILMEAGFILLVVIVATIGTSALTAQQISFTAMSLGFLPGLGFAITATALVGQSVGARRMDDARKAAAISQRWALVWMGAGAVLYLLAARPIIDLFTDDPDVIEQGISGLRTIGISLPLWGIWMVSAGSLRGSGDTRGPMIRGVITVWAAVALAWVGVRYFDQGIGWVWGTFILTSPIAAVGNLLSFRRRSKALEEEFHGGMPVSGVPVHHP